MVEAAFEYLRAGYRPIPIRKGTKKPHVKWEEFQHRNPTEDEVRGWWEAWPEANIAILTGEHCGMIALDVDGPEGEASLQTLGTVPATAVNCTGGGGRHHAFRHPGGHVKTVAGVAHKVDIRGDGGYIVVAPSVHDKTGVEYRWEGGAGLLPSPQLAEIPDWFRLLIAAPETTAGRDEVRGTIKEGKRDSRLAQIAGSRLGAGWSPESTLSELRMINSQRCKPPLPDEEVTEIVRSIAGREASKTKASSETTARPQSARPKFQRLSNVAPETVKWLWPGFIPLGKVTLLLGDPGLGKSTLTTGLAARVTAGTSMPDGTVVTPGGVVLLNAEDGGGDTVLPRFLAAGGVADRALVPDLTPGDGGKRSLVLPGDVEHLREAIDEAEARLVVIDPLMAYLAPDVNSWRDQDVRRALAPLTALAEETGAAIILVAHLNKKQGASAMYRGGGSIGITAAARAALVLARDPDDHGRRALAHTKMNVALEPEARTFRIVGASNGSSCIVWEGTSALTADQLLDQPRVSKLSQAEAFLREHLGDGYKPSRETVELAASRGISEHTLDRARKNLKVVTDRAGFQGRVMIGLPETPTDQGQSTSKRDLALNDDQPLSPSTGPLGLGPAEVGAVSARPLGANPHTPYDAEDWEERAAIAQYDGGLSPKAAELLAGPHPSSLTEAA